MAVTEGKRPVIFAATLSAGGRHDSLDVISEISKNIPLVLHVDASQSFDYITTLSEEQRKSLGVEKINLSIRLLTEPLRNPDGTIIATSIVAGGANHTGAAPAAALIPITLGANIQQERVAYIRASDSTLAGSRDALGPLWIALQEMRFGKEGFQRIYERCNYMRSSLLQRLTIDGVSAVAAPYSLDITISIENCSKEQKSRLISLGAISLTTGVFVITIQPSVTSEDLNSIVEILSSTTKTKLSPGASSPEVETTRKAERPSAYEEFSKSYRVPQIIIDELEETVQSWKIITRSAAGYPFYMGSYSALGSVIGPFLDLNIPSRWLSDQKEKLLKSRMASFGLNQQDITQFKGAFTNGSTMGNRMGIQAALMRLSGPGTFVYYSAETHYSVAKTMRDCDVLTNRWSNRKPRYSQIPCDPNGSVLVSVLVQKALADQAYCRQYGEEYRMILLANWGTTFIGARDDLKQIYTVLKKFGIEIAHIHVDGALDLGFGSDVKLGLPGMIGSRGMPLVQGITLSHHKAMGGMVSGEIICYTPSASRKPDARDELSLASETNPGDQLQLPALEWNLDPRIIFEAWLYAEVYTPADVAQLLRYCQNNAAHLQNSLKKLGVLTKRNPDSIIVVLERPPSWIIEEFSLRPEGDWVHFITMPHVSPITIDLFIDKIAGVKKQCSAAFSYINPLMEAAMARPVKLKSLQCQDPLAKQIALKVDGSIAGGVKLSIRSAMSIAILDQQGKLEAALMIESFRDKSIQVGPLLVRPSYANDYPAIIYVAKQLVGFMARHMDVELQTDDSSYTLAYFKS
ncbi:hypothetical protein ABW20_dc0101069 [Dactylellina cionopaga]|nr:hypothetical protein ABW20_dc0101069 [Dactylellina cionopaga]